MPEGIGFPAPRQLKPRPRVIQTLNSLKKKHQLAIVTDAPRDKAWQRLILSGLGHYFHPVVTYNDTGERKPSQKPFLHALSMLKMQPKDVLFVGDFPERDILGAKKAGMHTCLAKYGCLEYSPETDVADYTIDKIEDLKKVIEEIEGV
jgi:putative hydrolase of the HAD superfamily